MLGLWDVVSAPLEKYGNFQNHIRSPLVENLYHAMAANERRVNFPVMQYCPTIKGTVQTWFSGAHSDVGGGYPPKERELSDIALAWMKYDAMECGLEFIHTNQGYPACTVLKLTEKIAVTADDGMAKALSDKGITVYKIENSDKIKLPPYPYGFIGGCAGVFEDKVYFAGDLHFHPSCDIIKAAAAAAGLECVSLADGENLLDVGRLVFYDNGIDDYNGKRQ
jgi:hypothetical protein